MAAWMQCEHTRYRIMCMIIVWARFYSKSIITRWCATWAEQPITERRVERRWKNFFFWRRILGLSENGQRRAKDRVQRCRNWINRNDGLVVMCNRHTFEFENMNALLVIMLVLMELFSAIVCAPCESCQMRIKRATETTYWLLLLWCTFRLC